MLVGNINPTHIQHSGPPELRTMELAHGVMVRMIHKAASRLRRIRYWAGCLTASVQMLDGPSWEQRVSLGLCRDTMTMVQALESIWPQWTPSSERPHAVLRPPTSPPKVRVPLIRLCPRWWWTFRLSDLPLVHGSQDARARWGLITSDQLVGCSQRQQGRSLGGRQVEQLHQVLRDSSLLDLGEFSHGFAKGSPNRGPHLMPASCIDIITNVVFTIYE